MINRKLFALTVGLAIGTSGLPCRAEKTAEQIRVAVQKSLPLLGKTGPIFFKKSACISCHNISLPSMAMVLADQYGFEVNQQARRDNIEAALNSDIFFEQKRLMKLDGVPGRTMTTGYTLMALRRRITPPIRSRLPWLPGQPRRSWRMEAGDCLRIERRSNTASSPERRWG